MEEDGVYTPRVSAGADGGVHKLEPGTARDHPPGLNEDCRKSRKLHLTSYGCGYQRQDSKEHQMSDEQALRRLAREAITAERVPAGRPKGTWGGDGTGALCDICGLSISRHEIGFEVEFSGETAPARTYHLHTQCLAAWEFERHALETEQPQKRCNGRARSPPFPEAARPPVLSSHPAPAADKHRLSGTDKAGSMPDGERNVKDGGESP